MQTMPAPELEVQRARSIGIMLVTNAKSDRLPIDKRPALIACPTCDEGVLDVQHPKRCVECDAEGL